MDGYDTWEGECEGSFSTDKIRNVLSEIIEQDSTVKNLIKELVREVEDEQWDSTREWIRLIAYDEYQSLLENSGENAVPANLVRNAQRQRSEVQGSELQRFVIPEIIYFLIEIDFFSLEFFKNKDEVFKKKILQLIIRSDWSDTQKYYNSLDPLSGESSKVIKKNHIEKVKKFIAENAP